MIFHIRSIAYSIAFFLGLETIAFAELQNTVFIVTAVMLVLSLHAAYIIGRQWLFVFIPMIYSIVTIAMLALIDPPVQIHIFVVLSTVVYYVTLLSVHRLRNFMQDQTARGLLVATSTVTIFFFYAAAYGFYLNFEVPLWGLMIAFFLVTFIVSYNYLSIISLQRARGALLHSAALGFAMTQLIWAMSFWPFGYLTTGVIALIFYYILWDLIQSYFLNLLSRKRVVANVIFFTVLAGMVLISSRWLPAV